MKTKAKKSLILVRHAHRDKPHGSAYDNGISDKGRRQTERLTHYFRKHLKENSVTIQSSAKKRCVETVAPLAKLLKVDVSPSELLTEQGPRETSAELQARVKSFCKQWKTSGPGVLVACSHGDWLPICLSLLVGPEIELEKGAFARLDMVDNEIHLTWVVQSLKGWGN